MGDEPTPNERAAFEVAANRVRDLTGQLVMVGYELREAEREAYARSQLIQRKKKGA